jgi:hypothetical protein
MRWWWGKAYPETSLTMSLTKAVRLLRWPLVRETRGFDWRGVTFCIHASLVSLCPCSPCPSASSNLDFLSSSSIRVRRYISGWTYVTLVKADGNAGLLLDFLGHRGGRRWSMSSMEVRSSNRTFAIFTTKARRQARGPWCGAILGGLGDCCLRCQILDFTCTNPRVCD